MSWRPVFPNKLLSFFILIMPTQEATQAVAEAKNDALTQPIAEGNRARVLAQSGELDAALAALPHLIAVPGGIQAGDLRFSPYWDPLRKDPRFEALRKNPPPGSY